MKHIRVWSLALALILCLALLPFAAPAYGGADPGGEAPEGETPPATDAASGEVYEEELPPLPEKTPGPEGPTVPCGDGDEGIPLTEAYFPDSVFRSVLSAQADGDGDGTLSPAEIAGIRVLNLDVSNNFPHIIATLQGIEYLTELQELHAAWQWIHELDVSGNTKLYYLDVHGCSLSELDVSRNTALRYLNCTGNDRLTELDVSRNTALEYLDCRIPLKALDVSYNPALYCLLCGGEDLLGTGGLTTLDVSRNTALRYLYCRGGKLTSLDVSRNTALETLDCGANQLASLTLGRLPALKTLRCDKNCLTALDLRGATELLRLDCSANRLEALELYPCPDLEELNCAGNRFTSFSLAGNPELIAVYRGGVPQVGQPIIYGERLVMGIMEYGFVSETGAVVVKLTMDGSVEIDMPENMRSGFCGDDARWELADGVLTISGSGSMWKLAGEKSKWLNFADEINTIVVERGITEISDNAFFGCAAATEVLLPDSVTFIGQAAFAGCESLETISLPASLREIYCEAFKNCASLREITLPEGLLWVQQETFSGCVGLKRAVLPESAETIGREAFKNCAALEEISFPASLRRIDDSAFEGCAGLKELALPEGLESIGIGAFRNCTGLGELVIPLGIGEIRSEAFSGCTALRSVSGPIDISGVYSNQRNIFAGCTALRDIYYYGADTDWETYGHYYYNDSEEFLSRLTVHLMRNKAWLSYDIRGGRNFLMREPVYLTEGTEVEITMIEPTKEGYRFLGWAPDWDPDTLYQCEEHFLLERDTVLCAVWEWTGPPVQYTDKMSLSDGRGEPGDTVTLPITAHFTGSFTACEIEVHYDGAYLDLIGAERHVLDGDKPAPELSSLAARGPLRLTAAAYSDDPEGGLISEGDVLFTLTFKVLDNAPAGKAWVSAVVFRLEANAGRKSGDPLVSSVTVESAFGILRAAVGLPPDNVWRMPYDAWELLDDPGFTLSDAVRLLGKAAEPGP